MKKIFLLLIFTFGLLSLSKADSTNPDNKLTVSELKFIKDNYNWSSEELIIINFRQPRSSCHYDNYRNLKKSNEWWNKFYSKIELSNVRNIFVHSDSDKAKLIIDSRNHFADMNDYFLTKFFSKEKTCYGILIINKNGKYQKKSGEYNQKNILELISKLK